VLICALIQIVRKDVFLVSGGRCRDFLLLSAVHQRLTDEAEDVPDGGDEDDQDVVEGQDGGGDQQVANPAELSPAEQQRGDGGADLGEGGNHHEIIIT